jgi:hypothetical protein
MRDRVGRETRWFVTRLAVAAALAGILAVACASGNVPACSKPAEPNSGALVAATEEAIPDSETGEMPNVLAVEHISPVLAAASPRIKAKCWQPALDSRPPDTQRLRASWRMWKLRRRVA